MANLTTYCRITGNARNLPKPCYFPMLPPITPAESKKICSITRHAGRHNYSPIVAYAKPVKYSGITACSITKFTGFGYFRPRPVKELPDDDNLKFYNRLLESMRSRQHREISPETSYVYEIPNLKKCIVLPGELEEAIRIGEVESLGLSENNEHISIKIKEGRNIKIGMESVAPEVLQKEKISEGEGPSEAVIEQQLKTLEERNKRKQDTSEKRKLFEDKDKKAELDDIKSKERPPLKNPTVTYDPNNKKQKLENMKALVSDDKSILSPNLEVSSEEDIDEVIQYEQMFNDVKTAQTYALDVNVFETEKSEEMDDDSTSEEETEDSMDSSSEEEIIKPVKINKPVKKPAKIVDNVSIAKVDIVASVKTVKPAPKVNQVMIKSVEKLPIVTQNTMDVVSEMDDNTIPNISDIPTVVNCSKDDMTYGYVFKRDYGTEFVSDDDDEIISEEKGISGVMIPVENKRKFVAGQKIKLAEQQSFVAGQTIDTSEGLKFIPGLTVKNEENEVTFIPGTTVSDQLNKPKFVCGRIVETKAGKKETEFIPGQFMQVGNEKEVFTPGQTVVADDGLKFVPGETISDEEGDRSFVPGIKIEHKKEVKFMPGQVFSSDEGLKFTPGQIIDTNEGPSFIPGKSIETEEKGKVFVKGKTVINEYGEVRFENQRIRISENQKHIIPNKHLNPVADANGEITGFSINPKNTTDLEPGEKLYGSIVEYEKSVLFYVTEKLPRILDDAAKIISGELRVGECSQKFIPGKLMKSSDGEKFVPGQNVITNNGEEFVPGKIVEGSDGPKFIPGQVIYTEEGDKFVPGQVITDSDGPRFVPGQIIETEHGATFIPGQMMNTDKGRKFVPGQLIDTKEGPRFVPGQVEECQEGPKFLPGLIVETDEGLKYVPSETDDQEDDVEFTFQGFDITAEELLLLSTNIDDSDRHSPVTGEHGLIDSTTLRKLSDVNMIIRGRTPDPKKIKKNKTKQANVSFLSPNDIDSNEEAEDRNTDKIELLKGLKISQTTVSNHKKNRELKKMLNLIGEQDINQSDFAEAKAISYILSSSDSDFDIVRDYIGNDSQLIQEILGSIGDTDGIDVNSQVEKLLKNVMKSVVTKRCNAEVERIINQLNENPNEIFTDLSIQMLLAEAVGIVCITGDVEVASLLEQFISKPDNPHCLKEDKYVLEVLQQLIILHKVAKSNSDVGKILHNLRKDPANFKNKNELFRLISQAKLLLRKESKISKAFNIRHIASSKDIPSEMFEQLKESKMEADKFIENLPDELFYAILGDARCGEKLLDSLNASNVSRTMCEIEKFKHGMAIVVVKENMQAVIPRSYARSVYYGIMPYILIDEEGFKFFERGLTGRKLAPSKVIKNTWCIDEDDEDYLINDSHHAQFVPELNQQCSIVLPGMGFNVDNPCLQYTSLLSSSGPTRLPYFETASRRSSREGSITSFRLKSRSVTPSRRSSTSSLYDHFSPLTSDSYSRRGSAANTSISIAPTLSTISHLDDIEDSVDLNNSSAIVPYQENSDEETSFVRRSDTVANLLDKYSNFSVEKEFARPVISKKKPKPRYKCSSDYTDDDEDDPIIPLGGIRSRSLSTPEKDKAYLSNGRVDTLEHRRMKDVDHTRNRRLRRPISDIFEVDELESPTKDIGVKKLASHRLPPKSNRYRNHINETCEEDEERVDKYSLPVLSYSPRNRKAQRGKSSVGEYKPRKYSRRLSEPRMPIVDQSGQYSDTYPVGKYRPSRSEERDLLYSGHRECENGDSPYGSKRKKDKNRRYKHIDMDDQVSMGYKSAYDPDKPYNSNYLDPYDLSDDEERPSYQLLGRNIQTPSRTKGHSWQSGNQCSSMPPYTFNTGPAFNRTPLVNSSLPGPYEPDSLMHRNRFNNSSNYPNPRAPSVPFGAYDNNILPNLNYNYDVSPFFSPQSYSSRESVPYMEQSNSILDSYTDPSVRNVINKGLSGSYRDKYSRTPTKGRKAATKSSTDPKHVMNELLDSDSDEEIKLRLPEFKRFDASKYLGASDDSEYNDNDESSIKVGFNLECSPESDSNLLSDQRKLATDLAKKYLRSFSLEDKDDDDEEEEIL